MDDAYRAYIRKYTENVRKGVEVGQRTSTTVELMGRSLTRKEFEENIEILRDYYRSEGKRASSATKLGQKLANEQTRQISAKQAKIVRERLRELHKGDKGYKVPTQNQLLYGDYNELYEEVKKRRKELFNDGLAPSEITHIISNEFFYGSK